MNQKHQYPRAGKNAHPLVFEAIEEFRRLNPDIKENKILLYWLLGSGTPPYKMSKKDSHYQSYPSGHQMCGNCRFAYEKVINGKFICSQISGEIKPGAWCKLWKA